MKIKMEEYKHWANNLEAGDRCLATIRHNTDGTKNLHNVELIVAENKKREKEIIGWFSSKFKVNVPYNELTEVK